MHLLRNPLVPTSIKVMQQLEEAMEQCIEVKLEDEQRERLQPATNCTNGVSSTSRWREEVVSRSTLNPLAAEFVPTSSAKNNTQDLNYHRCAKDTRKLGRSYEMAKKQVNEPYQYGDFMYICTLSSLVEKPLKIAVIPGDYIMKPYLGGFVFTKTDYYPEISEIVHVLDNRSRDPGLSGTYHDGDSEDQGLLSIFNWYFRPFVQTRAEKDHIYSKQCWLEARALNQSYDYYSGSSEDEYDSDYYDSDAENNNIRNEFGQKYLTEIESYNNFPILFFLNAEPFVENITLELKYEDKENEIMLWDVFDKLNGKIGVAIKEKEFHNMMGDQMGLAVFSLNKTHGIAFANFDVYNGNLSREELDSDVFEPQQMCDLIYDKYDWNKAFEEAMKKRKENQ